MEDDELHGIEVIARGVCVVDDKILLCQGKKSGIAYLPGGHVEFQETARQALVREIQEELGQSSTAGDYLGTCEHQFLQNGKPHTEVNLVFKFEVPALQPRNKPEAKESWIGFLWQPVDQLDAVHFEPKGLGKVLKDWIAKPGRHLEIV